MTAEGMTSTRRTRPHWLPPDSVIDSVAAGRWWDAIAVDGPLGRLTAEHYLRHDGAQGPILCDPGGPVPRVYFLTPLCTADRWHETGSLALGTCCYVALTGTLTSDTLGVHWITPPLCRRPEPLVSPHQLRAALASARAVL